MGDLSAQVLGLCHVQSSFCLITTRGMAAYWSLFFDSLGVRITPVGKSAFCIFFVRLSLDATNHFGIAFFATFQAEDFAQNEKALHFRAAFSGATFYNHMLQNKRENAWFEKRRQEYCQLIRDVFDEYQQVLGAEKIQTILVQRGHQVSKEYVSRLMSEMGLRSVRMTAKKEYLKLREPERKENLLQQQFAADQPNQRWVSDVSCFKLRDH